MKHILAGAAACIALFVVIVFSISKGIEHGEQRAEADHRRAKELLELQLKYQCPTSTQPPARHLT